MDREEIYQKLVDLMVDQIAIDADDLDENTSLEDDLQVDSLDLLQIVTAIEDEFNITVDDDVFSTVKTLGEAVDYIKEQL
ncbi:MAG: acyl carrier protein [Coriobacteriales bacterium]|jgi:acyl carrier protein